ncbi:MAG: InlB B-repeat-containing protein [Clostridia bacterium]|nr:InlB B-repeat-containing protein [Clostridia bacterium]
MKRFLAILASILIVLGSASFSRAEEITDELPSLSPITGVEDIGSARAVLMDVDTGAVIYEKNSDTAARPGSLTAIMTALLLIENTDPGDWDTPLPALKTVNSAWTSRGAQMGLKKGDTPTRRDLLYALLLQGSADAAYVAETQVAGSETEFVDLMNSRASELGMTNTHFGNGYGLGSGSHYTCAHDMALLLRLAMGNDMFCIAVKTESFTCSDGARNIELHNTNEMLSSTGCIGVKSGSDSEKEHSLITAVGVGSARLAAIVLEASSDSMAYSLAERLIAAGMTVYATEGGYYPLSPTNAFFAANRDTYLGNMPGASTVSVPAGQGLRVCGSFTDANGDIYYCVYQDGSRLWAKAEDLSFVTYVDDIFIENGEALSREVQKADVFDISTFVTSRHLIKSVSVTLRLPDGTVVLSGEHSPNAHGRNDMAGTSFAEAFDSRLLSEGLYYCTVEVTAEASAAGCEPMTFTKTNSSILAVGTGGEAISYNANVGVDAPDGECFFDSFTIPVEIPTRTGFDFIGWNTSKDGSGLTYMPGETVASESSLTLYAMWKKALSRWTVDLSMVYDAELKIDGTVRNPAGITSLRLVVLRGGEEVEDRLVTCMTAEADAGTMFGSERILLQEGDHTIRLYGSSGGKEELLMEKSLSVNSEEASKTPVPEETAAPTEQAPNRPGFSFWSIPIFVWFILGAVVVAVLIWLIFYIIRHG